MRMKDHVCVGEIHGGEVVKGHQTTLGLLKEY